MSYKRRINVRAWHFVGETLRNGDPVPKNGKKLTFVGAPILYEQGLHGSLEPFDALQCARGSNLCLVEMGGQIIYGKDNLVATERTIICRMDATEIVKYFARMQILSIAHRWDIPDICLEYLMTGDENIRDAAQAAVWTVWAPNARDTWDTWATVRDAWAVRATARGALAAARKDFNNLVYECFSDWIKD